MRPRNDRRDVDQHAALVTQQPADGPVAREPRNRLHATVLGGDLGGCVAERNDQLLWNIEAGKLLVQRGIEHVVDERGVGRQIGCIGVDAVGEFLLIRVGHLRGQPVRVALGKLRLQRIVPGVAHGRSEEWRDAEPLRVGPQSLGEGLGAGKTRIDVAGICQRRESIYHGRVADLLAEQGEIGRIGEGHI